MQPAQGEFKHGNRRRKEADFGAKTLPPRHLIRLRVLRRFLNSPCATPNQPVEVRRSKFQSLVAVRQIQNRPQRHPDQSAGESKGQHNGDTEHRVSSVNRTGILERLVGDEQQTRNEPPTKTSACEPLFHPALAHAGNSLTGIAWQLKSKETGCPGRHAPGCPSRKRK